jgi:hypothetical protein
MTRGKKSKKDMKGVDPGMVSHPATDGDYRLTDGNK